MEDSLLRSCFELQFTFEATRLGHVIRKRLG